MKLNKGQLVIFILVLISGIHYFKLELYVTGYEAILQFKNARNAILSKKWCERLKKSNGS